MRETEVDVLVVGAGPAGCSAAYHLAARGIAALVVDQAAFPRDKVCGDGVAPRAVAALQTMGVETRIREAGYHPVRSFRVVGSWGQAVCARITPRPGLPDYAYVVPRRELDALLVAAAREKGAQVLEQVRALRCGSEAGSRLPAVRIAGPSGEVSVVHARYVVAADGARGSFSRGMLPEGALRPGVIALRGYMRGVRMGDEALNFFLDRPLLPGYGWIFPPGREGAPANVGVGMPVSVLRHRRMGLRGLFDWFQKFSTASAFLDGGELVGNLAAYPLQLTFVHGRRRVGQTLFVGDAANLVSPLSGEGIAYALESGRAAAEAVAAAIESDDAKMAAVYERRIRDAYAGDFLGGYLWRRFLSIPWANGCVVRLLRRDERLARGAMGILTNTISPLHLLDPRLWARVLAPARLRDTVRGTHPAGG